jgi:ubiquinone biosynthesis protein COQ4
MTNERVLEAPFDWVHARMRDTHDLWHAAVGYAGDVLGETALLAFIFAQTWNPGIGLILAIGLTKTMAAPTGGAAARRTILDGFRRGRKAAWLPAQPWEELLELPIAEVRRRLHLEAPPVYTEIRSAEIKAAQAA